jgi:2-polyprenyl-3-methyl-5-hydroxy-6-metoxy-1,4-benzoquinol methylase
MTLAVLSAPCGPEANRLNRETGSLSAACEVCGNASLVPIFEKAGHRYEKCRVCGLTRIHPQPTEQELEAIYQGGYYDFWGGEKAFRSLKFRTFASVLNMLPKTAQKGRLLDVGAATGILMELARELGYEAYGVEVARDGVSAIAEKFGRDHVFSGYFDRIDFGVTRSLGTFDVVSMIDLLEHVRDPNMTLHQANALLKSHGWLLLVLPDTSSWTAHILGKRWDHYNVEHLFSFSPAPLSRMLGRHGLQVRRLEPALKYLSLEYLQCHSRHYPGALKFLAPLRAVTPRWFGRIPIPLYSGQMQVMAQKEGHG